MSTKTLSGSDAVRYLRERCPDLTGSALAAVLSGAELRLADGTLVRVAPGTTDADEIRALTEQRLAELAGQQTSVSSDPSADIARAAKEKADA
jgi:hypothetical protein